MLPEKHAAFCREYIATGEQIQSAVRAGYKPTAAKMTSNRLLKRPEIQTEILRLRSKIEVKKILTAEETLEMVSGIARNADTDPNRMRALEFLGKWHSLLVERRETVKRDEFDGLTPEQFKQVAPKLRKDIEEWESKGLVS